MILATAALEKLRNKTHWPFSIPPSIRLLAFKSAIVVLPQPGPPVTNTWPNASRMLWRALQISIVIILPQTVGLQHQKEETSPLELEGRKARPRAELLYASA